MRGSRLAAAGPGPPDRSVCGVVQDQITVDLHRQAEGARTLKRRRGQYADLWDPAPTQARASVLGLTLFEAVPEDQSGSPAPFWSHHLGLESKSDSGEGK